MMNTYGLRCGENGTPISLSMDMYHGPEREKRQVPGFTVLAEHPARLAQGCPPRVVPDADSSSRYAYLWYEVERPFVQQGTVPEFVLSKVTGLLSISYVVDTAGRAEPASIKVSGSTDSTAVARGTALINSIAYTPAEHHAGCKVRQQGGRSVSVLVDSAGR